MFSNIYNYINIIYNYLFSVFQSFNSKQALNGHVRIHGGTGVTKEVTAVTVVHPRSNGTVEDKRYHVPTPPPNKADEPEQEFPCKICGK